MGEGNQTRCFTQVEDLAKGIITLVQIEKSDMKDKNFIDSALRVIEIELNAVKNLSNQIHSDFGTLCSKILDTKGKLIELNETKGKLIKLK